MKKFPQKKARKEFYEKEGLENYQQKLYGNPSDWIHHRIKNLSLGLVEKTLRSKVGVKVLDIGCAEGLYLRKLAPFLSQGIGIDIAASKIKRAQKLSKQFKNLSFLTQDFLDCQPKTQFDLIFSTEALEHIPHIKQVLVKINKSLNKGRIFICSVPTDKEMIFYQPSSDWKKISGHLYNWSKKDFYQLLKKAGFRIIRVYGVNNVATQIISRLIMLVFRLFKESKNESRIRKNKTQKKTRQNWEDNFRFTAGAKVFYLLDSLFTCLPFLRNFNNYNIFVCRKK